MFGPLLRFHLGETFYWWDRRFFRPDAVAILGPSQSVILY